MRRLLRPFWAGGPRISRKVRPVDTAWVGWFVRAGTDRPDRPHKHAVRRLEGPRRGGCLSARRASDSHPSLPPISEACVVSLFRSNPILPSRTEELLTIAKFWGIHSNIWRSRLARRSPAAGPACRANPAPDPASAPAFASAHETKPSSVSGNNSSSTERDAAQSSVDAQRADSRQQQQQQQHRSHKQRPPPRLKHMTGNDNTASGGQDVPAPAAAAHARPGVGSGGGGGVGPCLYDLSEPLLYIERAAIAPAFPDPFSLVRSEATRRSAAAAP